MQFVKSKEPIPKIIEIIEIIKITYKGETIMANHSSTRPIMTDEQHAKLQDLYALCNLCNYREICTEHCIRGNCPNTTGEYEAFKLPEDCIDFDHYATKVATEAIYGYLKKVRELVMLVHPEDPYLEMTILSKDSGVPGRIMFNNTHWELPEEKQINFHENVEDVPIPTNLQALIRDLRR